MTEKIKIIADKRELNGGVPKELDKLGADLEFQTLEVGDYIVSDRCAIERKNIDDFFKSWIEERKLFQQVIDMANGYDRPILLFEGGDPFYSNRQINPKAIQGMMNAFALMRIPILYSLNKADTAKIIFMLAKKEQSEKKGMPAMHGKRSHMAPPQQLEYTLSSLPDMGTVTAKALLAHFGSILAVAYAAPDELQEVPGIGKKTAERVYEFFRREYA